MNNTPSVWTIRLLLLTTVVLWASAFVGIRAGLLAYHPGSLALFRYMVASALMVIIYLRKANRRPVKKSDWPAILVVGALGIGLYNVALNYGEITVSAGISSFIIGLVPVLSTIIAVLFLGERLKWLGTVGVFVSLIGITIIAMAHHPGQTDHHGVLCLLVAALSMAVYSTLQKPLLKRVHGIQFAAYAMWSGTFVMLVYLPQLIGDIQHAPLSATLWVVYLGVFPGAVAYMCWSYVLSHVPACKTISAMYGIPLVATFLGWLFLGEMPELISLIGGFIALFGAYLVNRRVKGQKLADSK